MSQVCPRCCRIRFAAHRRNPAEGAPPPHVFRPVFLPFPPAALEETEAVFFDRAGLDRAAAERILDDTLQGADDGELYLQYAVSEGLTLDDGRLSGASYDISQGFGLRAVAGETTGYAHAASLDEPALRRAAEAVRAVSSGHGGVLALPPAAANRRLYGPENPLDGPDFAEKAALLGASTPMRAPPTPAWCR